MDQRISVISSTSSNTTSGIVSDKVHSHDESEGKCTSLNWAFLYRDVIKPSLLIIEIIPDDLDKVEFGLTLH